MFYLSQFGEFKVWWAPMASKSKARALWYTIDIFMRNWQRFLKNHSLLPYKWRSSNNQQDCSSLLSDTGPLLTSKGVKDIPVYFDACHCTVEEDRCDCACACDGHQMANKAIAILIFLLIFCVLLLLLLQLLSAFFHLLHLQSHNQLGFWLPFFNKEL